MGETAAPDRRRPGSCGNSIFYNVHMEFVLSPLLMIGIAISDPLMLVSFYDIQGCLTRKYKKICGKLMFESIERTPAE